MSKQAEKNPDGPGEGLRPGQVVIVNHKWGGPPSIATVVRKSGPGVYELKDVAGIYFLVGADCIWPRDAGTQRD